MYLLELFVAGIDVLGSVVELTVVTLCLLQSGVGIVTLLDEVHHLAQVDELVTGDQVFLVQSDAGNIPILPWLKEI